MMTELEVVGVAYLARVSLSEEEIKILSEQLSFVLQNFEQVKKVDTTGVEPLFTPTDIESHWREDEVVAWEGADSATANAPETLGHLFKVPPVVG